MTLTLTIPPGLTCAACHKPLPPAEATRTDLGYIHTGSCLDGDIPGVIGGWCKVEDCPKHAHGHGYCAAHYHRWRRHGDPLAGRTHVPLVIEDVEWMVETGESLTGAARRLGRTQNTLEQALLRADRHDLYRALAAREGDWNSPGRIGRYKQGVA